MNKTKQKLNKKEITFSFLSIKKKIIFNFFFMNGGIEENY